MLAKEVSFLSTAYSNLDSADSIPKLKIHVIANKYLQDDSKAEDSL